MTPVELDSSALKNSVAFTGRLACMTRAQAFEVVAQRDGIPSPDVTKRTKLLIVGELGWPLLDDGRPSNKLSRASAYGVPIVSERRFLEWIEKAIPDNLHNGKPVFRHSEPALLVGFVTCDLRHALAFRSVRAIVVILAH
jgi:hypothetical protein